VRARESILFYSEPRVILSHEPAATLTEGFGSYVERRFAHAPEYQERVMCQRLERVFDEAKVLNRYLRNEQIGDERYHATFPFVKRSSEALPPFQAIKALHLDRDESTAIFRHADAWRSTVTRLRGNGTAPQELLFVLQGPQNRSDGYRQAYEQVRRDLDQDAIPHVAFEATPTILEFANR
jgi:hypothetical protein